MNNFEFYCPTKVLFGKGTIAELPRLIDKSQKVLMIYGGGSIKRNGVTNRLNRRLKAISYMNLAELSQTLNMKHV